MCDIDGELATVWNERWRVARVEHRCHECNFRVPKGAHYTEIRMLCDHRWSTGVACFGCTVAMEEFAEVHYFRPFPGDLADRLVECLDYESHSGDRDRTMRLWRVRLAQINRRRGLYARQKSA